MNDETNQGEFEKDLRASLQNDFELADEIWQLIRWLEKTQSTYEQYGCQFIMIYEAEELSIWSSLAFVIETDMLRHWFGKEGLESDLVPLLRCGEDGSHIAVWKDNDRYVFVFLGSEGDVFEITDDVREFIALITMGYTEIMGEDTFHVTPKEEYAETYDTIWPKPVLLRQWVKESFKIEYREKASDFISVKEDDPFSKFVIANNAYLE